VRIKGFTFLGWVQLTDNKVRFATALAGVGFSVMLIFMQLGFKNMLFDTTVMLHKELKADIVMINPTAREISTPGSIPRRKLLQAMGVEGVTRAEPIYIGKVDIVKPDTLLKGSMLIIGIDPQADVFANSTLATQQSKLSCLGVALIDDGTRGNIKVYLDAISQGEEPLAQIGGKNVPLVGSFKMGAGFGSDGNVIVSEDTFAYLTKLKNSGSINLGLLKITPGLDPEIVAARIAKVVGTDDVAVMSMANFIVKSRAMLEKDSPIAYIFGFGVIIGLLVGIITVVQILSTDVQDHLPEYATFKAIGFSDTRLLLVVYEQSIILTIFGFLPGFLIALGCYQIIYAAVAMPIAMPLERVISVLAMTAAMCILSGTIAMRKLRNADPAEVF
jgi:putative ABC transport system permease protein